MTEHLDPAATAQDLLDALLPRRDPRYEAAHAFLSAHLATAPAIRRLALRALKGAAQPEEKHETDGDDSNVSDHSPNASRERGVESRGGGDQCGNDAAAI